jgi:1,4-alpha-glucan branching enzyme
VRNIDIIHVNDGGREIAFRRFAGNNDLLIVASLNNGAFEDYVIQTEPARLPDGAWRDLFNSDGRCTAVATSATTAPTCP